MIKLKNILKEGVYGKYWWMNSNGKFIRIMKTELQTGHKESAEQMLLSMGIEPSPKDVFNQLYNLGWVRVELERLGGKKVLAFNCGFNRKPSNTQMLALRSLAGEENAHEIRNLSNRNDFIEYDPPMGTPN